MHHLLQFYASGLVYKQHTLVLKNNHTTDGEDGGMLDLDKIVVSVWGPSNRLTSSAPAAMYVVIYPLDLTTTECRHA
jgi:hypothetical protein